MTIVFRPGTPDDSYAVFQVFLASVSDLGQRTGTVGITGGDDPAVLAELWERRRSLFQHLARTAEHFWVAEDEGQILGYARSTFHGGLRELTEFFVMPGHQSAGIGRELLSRAFPAGGASNRAIIATIDVRAQARYLKTGVKPRFPICNFSRKPEPVPMPQTALTVTPVANASETLAAFAAIDDAILGFRRDPDHAWLLNDRQGYIYTLDDQPVGYGYVGFRSGPFALLDDTHFPTVLAHAEAASAASGFDYFAVELPLINSEAVNYLLDRGFKLDSFLALFLTEKPFGQFENYAFTSPPFFI